MGIREPTALTSADHHPVIKAAKRGTGEEGQQKGEARAHPGQEHVVEWGAKGGVGQQPVRQVWGSTEGSSPLFSLELAVLFLAPPLPHTLWSRQETRAWARVVSNLSHQFPWA